eukprot:2311587-Rhodomonas_salina.1
MTCGTAPPRRLRCSAGSCSERVRASCACCCCRDARVCGSCCAAAGWCDGGSKSASRMSSLGSGGRSM